MQQLVDTIVPQLAEGAARTGYKIIRAIVRNGVPTGEYEDFVTGFVIDDASVWGRPVGALGGSSTPPSTRRRSSELRPEKDTTSSRRC
jgi:hypothetical protein